MDNIFKNIEKAGVIPVVALKDISKAVSLCESLSKADMKIIEITFRTEGAAEIIKIIRSRFPDFILGAGTITRLEEIQSAKEAGAQFAVAPGLNPEIVKESFKYDLPFAPGVCTPSEIEAAMNLGLSYLKFFPAGACGGIKYLNSIYTPYAHRKIRFMPTGDVGPENMAEYLSNPAVFAVGGTWICKKSYLESEDWNTITKLAIEAKQIVKDLNLEK